MNKFFIIVLFWFPLCSMDKLPKEKVSAVIYCIQQMKFARDFGDHYFLGEVLQHREPTILNYLRSIETIFDNYSINHPKEKPWNWLENLEKELLLLKNNN